MGKTVALLVALAPAFACGALCIAVEVVPRLTSARRRFLSNEPGIHALAETLSHAAFYGPAVTAILGLKNIPWVGTIAAVGWFVALVWLSYALRCRLHELDRSLKGDEK